MVELQVLVPLSCGAVAMGLMVELGEGALDLQALHGSMECYYWS